MAVRLFAAAFAAALVLGVAFGGSPASVLAHEHRAVGNYGLTVGFLTEPAFAGYPNGLDLRIALFPNGAPKTEEEEAAAGEGTPIEGAEKTLKAVVISGGGAATMDLALDPAFGQPGAYEGHFIPTLAGDYQFHITGTIDGTNIDETFESGPDTFGPMEDPKDLEFPVKVSNGAELTKQVDDLTIKVNNLDTGSDSDTAMILAIVGIVVGAVGLGVGGLALARSRRS